MTRVINNTENELPREREREIKIEEWDVREKTIWQIRIPYEPVALTPLQV